MNSDDIGKLNAAIHTLNQHGYHYEANILDGVVKVAQAKAMLAMHEKVLRGPPDGQESPAGPGGPHIGG